MANLDDLGYQARILAEVGDTAAGTIEADLPVIIWPSYADKGALDKELQYLYAKRTALDYRLGDLGTRVQTAIGPLTKYYQQQFDHYAALRAQTQTELLRMEARAALQGGVAIGQITTVVPQTNPNPAGPDETDPTFIGSPYYPIRRITT